MSNWVRIYKIYLNCIYFYMFNNDFWLINLGTFSLTGVWTQMSFWKVIAVIKNCAMIT